MVSSKLIVCEAAANDLYYTTMRFDSWKRVYVNTACYIDELLIKTITHRHNKVVGMTNSFGMDFLTPNAKMLHKHVRVLLVVLTNIIL